MSNVLKPARDPQSGGWADVRAKLDALLGDDCPPEARRILESVKRDLVVFKEFVSDQITDIHHEYDR